MAETPGNPARQRPGRFGSYEIVRRLGIGGMAETFEAIRYGEDGFSQRVCLKLALPFLRDDDVFIQLFRREARLAAKLRHSNIVGVLDYGTVDNTPYMALELVDGVDLLSLLEQSEKLGWEHVALFAVELAKGLSHAHNDSGSLAIPGVVHRDISPSNVMLSEGGEVMLTDFGVAKAMSGASRHQSAVKGKVPYMSPEQLRNDSLDGRSDLFSLGVVLFECMCGSRPYDGGNDPATIMRILAGEHAPLWQLAREAPRELCDTIDRLLELEPDRRPPTASCLIEELDAFAPPPRCQQELGRMVSEIHRAVRASSPDGVFDDAYDMTETPGQKSGVVPGVADTEQQVEVVDEPGKGKTHVGMSAALAVLIVAAMLGGIFLFAMRLM